MAEALDVLFDSFKFIESKAEHDEHNTRSRSAAVERINLCDTRKSGCGGTRMRWRRVGVRPGVIGDRTPVSHALPHDGRMLHCSMSELPFVPAFSGARRNDHARFARCR